MVPVEKQLLLFLWFAATQENYIRLGDRFGVGQTTAIKCVDRVSLAIIQNVMPKVLKWPNLQEARKIMQGFSVRGLRKVIGAIDGSHISIKAPVKNQENYVNRKGFHSIVLQAVCDHRMKFTDCYVGWPGSVHDSRVYTNSDLFYNIENNPIDYCPDSSYLLGDAAYPLSKNLLTPYKDLGNFSEIEKNYNFVQSSSRCVIERAFGLLKGKFQRLKHMELEKLEIINQIIHAITTLHNFCIIQNEDNSFINIEEEYGFDNGPTNSDQILNVVGTGAEDIKRFRDNIAKELFFDTA